MEYNDVYFVEIQLAFRRNMSLQCLRIDEYVQQQIRMKQATWKDGFSLGLLLKPEDGGDVCLRNVGLLSPEYTALYPRR
jgi:hypothetical protein